MVRYEVNAVMESWGEKAGVTQKCYTAKCSDGVPCPISPFTEHPVALRNKASKAAAPLERILAEGAIALLVTLSGSALFAS